MTTYEQARINRERHMIVVAANVMSSGATYCYVHHYVDAGCSQCHPQSFPDLGPYSARARTLIDAQRFRPRGKHERSPRG